jgi:hypothetical protein
MSDYCRQARRIRAEHRGDPVRTQQALSELSRKSDGDPRPRRSDWSDSAVLGPRGGWARNFADLVARQMVGPLLPWTARRSLLREAARRNIKPFEANLIIAAVQHQLGASAVVQSNPRTPIRDGWAWPMGIATAVAIEAALIIFVWRLAIG